MMQQQEVDKTVSVVNVIVFTATTFGAGKTPPLLLVEFAGFQGVPVTLTKRSTCNVDPIFANRFIQLGMCI